MKIHFFAPHFQSNQRIETGQQQRVRHSDRTSGDINRNIAVPQDIFSISHCGYQLQHTGKFIAELGIKAVPSSDNQ